MYSSAWIVMGLMRHVPQQAHTQPLGKQWVGGDANMQ
jgi:hypothetical protein